MECILLFQYVFIEPNYLDFLEEVSQATLLILNVAINVLYLCMKSSVLHNTNDYRCDRIFPFRQYTGSRTSVLPSCFFFWTLGQGEWPN